MGMGMTVIKRDGKRETVKFDKITSRIEGVVRTFNGLEVARRARLTESRDADGAPALDIDPVMVSQKVCSALVDGIKSEDIDRVAAEVAQSLCLTHPDYSVLAGLMCISNLHKCTANTFSEYAESVYTAGVLSEETISICRSNSQELQALLDDSHDYAYDFFAYKTLEKSYLTKEPVTRNVLERPQYMWLRVAIGIHGNDLAGIAETYGAFVTGRFTHASPTLFNAGTTHPQLASCFLLEVEDDSMEGIFDTLKDCAMISKYAGGLGLHISKIRGNGSHIAGTNGTSSGIVPMCSVFEKTLKFSDQSSKRAGSAAMYLEPWHVDVEDFLELRLPTGAEERRCRDLFTAMFINDLFMRRVKANATWSLFNEHTTPGLCDAFGEEFDALYERYEAEGKWVKQVNAQDLWLKMCYSAIMTGTPYITFKDAVNRKTNQSNIGVIKSSNLCIEVMQVSTPTETAVCNLASVNPVACIDRETKTFDFDKLGQSVAILVRNLNKVIDRTFYPTEKCRRSNFRHRPMGIGLSGLHTAFMVLRYPFESPEARRLNREIYECMYYHAIKESCDLAKVHGAYETFAGSPLSEGRFQFDLWGVTPSDQYDWAALRADVMTHGVRNSLLLACMPTASSASIIGNSESNDPVNSNLYSRKISAGEYALVNRFLVDDLIKAGLWTQEVKDQLLASEGSVQDIDGVPHELKALYRTCFEMSMKSVIEMSADRGAFICQSQSLNLFMTEPTAARVSSMLFYSWSKGLKTGMYYLRTKARGAAAKFTIDPEVEKAAKAKREAAAAKGDDRNNQQAAVVCRRDDPDCLACSA